MLGGGCFFVEAMVARAAGQRKSETPKAADAFRRYVALGPGRSLRKLAAILVDQKLYKTETTAFNALANWSGEYHWQDRIAAAESEAADRMLEEAARLDADTFLRTSQLLNDRVQYTDAGHLDAVIKMRESVRKPMPKGGASVNVKVSVEVRQLAEAYAQQLGIDADELIREAELIAAGEWERTGSAA